MYVTLLLLLPLLLKLCMNIYRHGVYCLGVYSLGFYWQLGV
jgi:hypothetical protein